MTVEELRQKMIQDLEAAFFIGGFGGTILEAEEIKRATDEEVIEIAKRKGYILETKPDSGKIK